MTPCPVIATRVAVDPSDPTGIGVAISQAASHAAAGTLAPTEPLLEQHKAIISQQDVAGTVPPEPSLDATGGASVDSNVAERSHGALVPDDLHLVAGAHRRRQSQN